MSKRWTTHRASESARATGEGHDGSGVRGALLRERSHAWKALPPAAANSADPMDAARDRVEAAVSLAVLQHRHERDTTVREVLQSLATGQYGRCVECGHHIAVARLRAMPLSVRCLACQERFERAHRIAEARESRYDALNLQEVTL